MTSSPNRSGWPASLLVLLLALGLVTTALIAPAAAAAGVRSSPAAGQRVVPLPVVPRDAYGWPIGPDRGGGATSGAGPPPRAGDDGSVTRRFRAPPNPYGRGHRGVDLAGLPGEMVRAAGAGTVAFAGSVAGRGVVSVDHADGLRTTYEPVTTTVAVGAAVARGSPLGTLEPGHSGCSVVACLHWGLRRSQPDGTVDYLDPLLLLGLGRVRLLPNGP